MAEMGKFIEEATKAGVFVETGGLMPSPYTIDRAADEFLRWVRPSDRTDVVAARLELTRLLDEYLFSMRRREGAPIQFGSSGNEDDGAVGPDGASFEIEVLRLVRAYGMSVAPSVVAYFKAVVTANAVIFELSPEFDLAAVENRFFGTMLLQDVDELRPFRNLSTLVYDYAYRVTRALDFVDQTEAAERTATGYVDRIRRRIEAMAVATGLLVVAFLLPPFRHVIQANGWLYWGLAATFVVLVAAIFHQGRRLNPRVARARGVQRAFRGRDARARQRVP